MAKGKRRYGRKRQVVRLPDRFADAEVGAPVGAGPSRPWHVVVLTDADRHRLYTTMTQDIGFTVHRATSALAGGYAQEHGIGRLVLTEEYLCRHTAFARMMRIRGWPVAERRRLIEASNPDWADLSQAGEGLERTQPTMPSAPSAAA